MVAVGVLLLPVPAVGAHLLDAVLSLPAQLTLGLGGVGVALGDVAGAARVNGRSVTTLEGLQEEAAEFGAFIADQGAEQCGFCNPGFIMNALALFRENPDPGEDEIKEYLAGNLCRCSGYEGQLRGILNFLAWKKGKEAAQ